MALMRSCSVGVRPAVGSGVTSPTRKTLSCFSYSASLVSLSTTLGNSLGWPTIPFCHCPMHRGTASEEEPVMKILLAGGTGVLGRATVPRLVAAGHDVSVVSRRAEADQ